METTFKLQVSFDPETRGVISQLAKSLNVASDTIARGEPEAVSTPTPSPKPGKTVKNGKAKESAVEAAAEEVDLGFEDEGEAEIEFKDVVAAFQSYSAKYSRAEAGKILTKFKVKSVKDLKPEQYADVLKAAKI